AARVDVLAGLTHALDLADASVDLGTPVTRVAAYHDAVGDRLDLPWLMAQLSPQSTDTHWEQAAKAALREEITEQWVLLPRAALTGAHPSTSRVRAVVGELRAQQTVHTSMLIVAVRELRRTAAEENL